NMKYGNEDWDFWISAVEKGFIGTNIHLPLFIYRCKTNSMLARKRATLRRSATCHSSTPLVSVIIPTYNRPDMLVGAVKSVLAQTFTNFEIIVINDCGIDVSEIFTVIDDKRITYINHEVSKGPAATRNTGIRAARGKYIAYLDDDDIYYPDHLEILVSWLENNPEYKVAYTDAYRAHQEPDGVGGYVVVKKDVPYSFDFDYERIFHINFIPILCIVHAKECMEVVGMFDESLRSHEDWDLWMRMSQQFRFYHIAKLTSEFRRRTDYTSLSFSNHMQETYRIVKAKGQLIKK
ncbi:MAG: glycosyltransferase family 2 protein, partial [Trichlorobacter sp.]|nr:glycosyltransferase family 2 protein [Trichlorobacter sp.]